MRRDRRFISWLKDVFRKSSRIPVRTIEEIWPELLWKSVTIEAASSTRSGVRHVELLYLAYLAKLRPRMQIFEFGTAAGRTTLQLALNVEMGHVYTLDLPTGYSPDRSTIMEVQIPEVTADKRGLLINRTLPVTLLSGDSTKFDFRPYYGAMDLVFVDGGHTRRCIENDTTVALRLINSQGIIVWHDYLYHSSPEVWEYLNDLANDFPLIQLRDTKCVIYVK